MAPLRVGSVVPLGLADTPEFSSLATPPELRKSCRQIAKSRVTRVHETGVEPVGVPDTMEGELSQSTIGLRLGLVW